MINSQLLSTSRVYYIEIGVDRYPKCPERPYTNYYIAKLFLHIGWNILNHIQIFE